MFFKHWNKLGLLTIILLVAAVISPNLSHAKEGLDSQVVGTETLQGDEITYHNFVLGVEVRYSNQLHLLEDQYLGESYGFTLLDPADPDSLILRISYLPKMTPDDVENRVQNILKAFPNIPIRVGALLIDGIQATKLSPVPGITESSYVYVIANDRLYEFIYGSNIFDSHIETVLSSVHFEEPTQLLESIGLPKSEDVIYVEPPVNEGDGDKEDEQASIDYSTQAIFSNSQPFSPATATAQGCVDFPTWKYLQTQWGSTANNGTGKSWAGPYYFGQGGHVDCNSTGSLNDYYDLDHSLVTWNTIYPPASGTVLYAGWAGGGWCSLGRIVVIDLGSGYKALAANLRSVIAFAPGTQVTTSTLIGYAGGSSCNADGVYNTHLHQGRYLNAILSTNPAGLFGGQSAQPIKVYYSGGYYWYITNGQEMKQRP